MNNQPAFTCENRKRGSVKDFFVNYGLYAVFLALIGFFSIKNPAFLTVKNGVTILQMASTLGVVVVGMFFVLITAGIDISVASNMYFSAVVACTLLNTFKIPIWLCFVVSMLSGCLIGSINGLFIAKFKMLPFITTLATSSIARGLGLLVSHTKLIVLDQSAFVVSNTRILGVPLVAYIFVLMAVIGHVILRRTTFGRQLFACGNNLQGAKKIGINGEKTIFLAYLFCGAMAGLAGMMNACNLSSVNQNFAIGDEFVVISSAVVGGASLFGGKGRVLPGALIGILMVQVIMNGLTLIQASPYIYTVIRGLVIFVAVMIDSIKFSGEIR
ncbi:MAG TPA: ABC transporter permease [Candidatus Limiplasma sp.]|nr:ABC transporter permease [Candidatus Limiplasma sp.]HPS80732.1 ABC transporter permease [Candidatus Limiplasma sp.]